MFASEIRDVVYSDEEESPMDTEVGTDSWENFTLRFGKFKGMTLSDMIKKGRTRGYLRYILSWPDIRPHTAANIDRALQVYNASKDARHGFDMPQPVPLARAPSGSEAFPDFIPIPLARTDTYDDRSHSPLSRSTSEAQRPRFKVTRKR